MLSLSERIQRAAEALAVELDCDETEARSILLRLFVIDSEPDCG